MEQKSLNELTLEMIRSHRDFTANHIQDKRNKQTYNNTINFVLNCSLFFHMSEFLELRNTFYRFKESTTFLTANMSKYDKKYFDLAVEHCDDIINSVEKRFGYEG